MEPNARLHLQFARILRFLQIGALSGGAKLRHFPHQKEQKGSPAQHLRMTVVHNQALLRHLGFPNTFRPRCQHNHFQLPFLLRQNGRQHGPFVGLRFPSVLDAAIVIVDYLMNPLCKRFMVHCIAVSDVRPKEAQFWFSKPQVRFSSLSDGFRDICGVPSGNCIGVR